MTSPSVSCLVVNFRRRMFQQIATAHAFSASHCAADRGLWEGTKLEIANCAAPRWEAVVAQRCPKRGVVSAAAFLIGTNRRPRHARPFPHWTHRAADVYFGSPWTEGAINSQRPGPGFTVGLTLFLSVHYGGLRRILIASLDCNPCQSVHQPVRRHGVSGSGHCE